METSFQVAFRKASERKAPQHDDAGVSKAPTTTTTTGPADALSVDFSYDSDIMAVGTTRGVMLLHEGANFRPASFEISGAMCRGEALNSAASCVRFQPNRGGSGERTKDLLLVASTDGTVSQWHLGSAQMVFGHKVRAFGPEGETNEAAELYCCDYAMDGRSFCASGRDGVIRLYDAVRGASTTNMRFGQLSDNYPAHTGRVQACRWVPQQEIILSGGGDTTVQQWDTRVGKSVCRVPDTLVAGPDAIDVFGSVVVVANNRPQRGLQFFDMRSSLKPLFELTLPVSPATSEWVTPEPSSLFAARFSPDGKFLAVGGSSDFRVYDFKRTLHEANFQIPATVSSADENEKVTRFDGVQCGTLKSDGGAEHAVFSVAWNPSSTLCGVVGYGNSMAALRKVG